MIHHDHMASAQDLFGQLWKEYALSDSRYMTSDTLVLCMETMTVVSSESHTSWHSLRLRNLILDTPYLETGGWSLGFTADFSFFLVTVGAPLLRCCILDRNQGFPAPPDPGDCVHEPSLRRHAVLCDQSV